METGTIINQYKIISAIGKGGMGEVFLAQDTKLDRKVALKILPPEFAGDKDRMIRFVREAQSASALNHPNIITIYEIGESDGTHFIATEFIDGKTLSEYTQVSPLNYKSALEIAIQIASALDEAHHAGIVHRDIKPDNVMIRANGLAKLLDFGIAKLSTPKTTSEEDATAVKGGTSPGMIIGTANYMSPEQAEGKELDSRTDIFSFGVLFYEMIAGQLPFEGDSAMKMIGAILKDEPKPLNSDVPAEISKIIKKCLRKNRDQRYQTIKDVVIDLKDVKQEMEFMVRDSVRVTPLGVNLPNDQATQILQACTTAEEITPQGVTLTSRYFAAGLLTLLLAVGGFIGYKYFSPPNRQISSIAVMPFENKNSDADTEYLSDGLAESLIYRLSQLPDLKVSPTSSVFRYKGKEADPQVIAKELGVDSVMTGRITQRGDSLTISVNLVDTRNGKSLWGEQYERKMSELLNTQREIASEITSKLRLKLSGETEQKLAKKYTDNNEAYQLYLKGRYLLFKQSKDDIKSAIEYFQQAIKLDPNFARAYVGIANSYLDMASYPYISSREAAPLAKAAVQRALLIDPDLAEAHTSLAYVLAFHDYNWGESGREFTLAIELNPNIAEVHHYYSHQYLLPFGRFDEALKESTRAFELEPLAIAFNAPLAGTYLYVRQNKQSVEQAKKTLELDPNHLQALSWVSYIYNANGMYPEALELYERAKKLGFGDNQDLLALAGYAYAKTGRRREAEEIIDKFKEIDETGVILHSSVAGIYTALGDKDKAFTELEKAFEERDYFMPRIKVDPFMDPLRDDPRFRDLLKRMGLPE